MMRALVLLALGAGASADVNRNDCHLTCPTGQFCFNGTRDCVDCPFPSRCETSGNGCVGNSVGVGCAECALDHYNLGGTCADCPNTPVALFWVLITVIALCLLGGLWYLTRKPDPSKSRVMKRLKKLLAEKIFNMVRGVDKQTAELVADEEKATELKKSIEEQLDRVDTLDKVQSMANDPSQLQALAKLCATELAKNSGNRIVMPKLRVLLQGPVMDKFGLPWEEVEAQLNALGGAEALMKYIEHPEELEELPNTIINSLGEKGKKCVIEKLRPTIEQLLKRYNLQWEKHVEGDWKKHVEEVDWNKGHSFLMILFDAVLMQSDELDKILDKAFPALERDSSSDEEYKDDVPEDEEGGHDEEGDSETKSDEQGTTSKEPERDPKKNGHDSKANQTAAGDTSSGDPKEGGHEEEGDSETKPEKKISANKEPQQEDIKEATDESLLPEGSTKHEAIDLVENLKGGDEHMLPAGSEKHESIGLAGRMKGGEDLDSDEEEARKARDSIRADFKAKKKLIGSTAILTQNAAEVGDIDGEEHNTLAKRLDSFMLEAGLQSVIEQEREHKRSVIKAVNGMKDTIFEDNPLSAEALAAAEENLRLVMSNTAAYLGIGTYHLQISGITLSMSITFSGWLIDIGNWISLAFGFDIANVSPPECHNHDPDDSTEDIALNSLLLKVAYTNAAFLLALLIFGGVVWFGKCSAFSEKICKQKCQCYKNRKAEERKEKRSEKSKETQKMETMFPQVPQDDRSIKTVFEETTNFNSDDVEEFYNWWITRAVSAAQQFPEQTIQKVFDQYDTDKSNTLDEGEVKRLIAELHGDVEQGLSDEEKTKAKADIEKETTAVLAGNETVDFKNFYKWWLSRQVSIDAGHQSRGADNLWGDRVRMHGRNAQWALYILTTATLARIHSVGIDCSESRIDILPGVLGCMPADFEYEKLSSYINPLKEPSYTNYVLSFYSAVGVLIYCLWVPIFMFTTLRNGQQRPEGRSITQPGCCDCGGDKAASKEFKNDPKSGEPEQAREHAPEQATEQATEELDRGDGDDQQEKASNPRCSPITRYLLAVVAPPLAHWASRPKGKCSLSMFAVAFAYVVTLVNLFGYTIGGALGIHILNVLYTWSVVRAPNKPKCRVCCCPRKETAQDVVSPPEEKASNPRCKLGSRIICCLFRICCPGKKTVQKVFCPPEEEASNPRCSRITRYLLAVVAPPLAHWASRPKEKCSLSMFTVAFAYVVCLVFSGGNAYEFAQGIHILNVLYTWSVVRASNQPKLTRTEKDWEEFQTSHAFLLHKYKPEQCKPHSPFAEDLLATRVLSLTYVLATSGWFEVFMTSDKILRVLLAATLSSPGNMKWLLASNILLSTVFVVLVARYQPYATAGAAGVTEPTSILKATKDDINTGKVEICVEDGTDRNIVVTAKIPAGTTEGQRIAVILKHDEAGHSQTKSDKNIASKEREKDPKILAKKERKEGEEAPEETPENSGWDYKTPLWIVDVTEDDIRAKKITVTTEELSKTVPLSDRVSSGRIAVPSVEPMNASKKPPAWILHLEEDDIDSGYVTVHVHTTAPSEGQHLQRVATRLLNSCGGNIQRVQLDKKHRKGQRLAVSAPAPPGELNRIQMVQQMSLLLQYLCCAYSLWTDEQDQDGIVATITSLTVVVTVIAPFVHMFKTSGRDPLICCKYLSGRCCCSKPLQLENLKVSRILPDEQKQFETLLRSLINEQLDKELKIDGAYNLHVDFEQPSTISVKLRPKMSLAPTIGPRSWSWFNANETALLTSVDKSSGKTLMQKLVDDVISDLETGRDEDKKAEP